VIVAIVIQTRAGPADAPAEDLALPAPH